MYLLIGVYGPTRQLLQRTLLVHIAELVWAVFSRLYLQVFEMYGTLVDTYGRSRLHPCRYDTMTGDTFREMWNSRLCNTSARNHFPSDVHQSVQESAGCYYHAFRINLCTPDRSHANGMSIFNE